MIRKIYKVGLIALGAWLAITLLTGCECQTPAAEAGALTPKVTRYHISSRMVDVFVTETGERVFILYGSGGIAVYPTGE